MIAKKVITIEVLFVTTVYLLFIFSDNLPWSMVICGLVSQILHAVILTDFPYVKLVSIQFIGAVVMLFVNHYLAFSFFTHNYYNFSEVNLITRPSDCYYSLFFSLTKIISVPNFVQLLQNDFNSFIANWFSIHV